MGTLLPKPPPMSGEMIRMFCSGSPATNANSVRWACGACEVIQMVVLPVAGATSATRPLERCGCGADVDPATGKTTIWMTSQAPHAHRTLFALVAGLPEQNIRIISPDIGGGFGNKVPIYPGYVVATAASLLIGRPVKWVEDRSENLISTGFARDYHMSGEMALSADGKILGLRSKVIADHGAFNAAAQPSKFPAGLFHIFTGSYDVPAAYCEV